MESDNIVLKQFFFAFVIPPFNGGSCRVTIAVVFGFLGGQVPISGILSFFECRLSRRH